MPGSASHPVLYKSASHSSLWGHPQGPRASSQLHLPDRPRHLRFRSIRWTHWVLVREVVRTDCSWCCYLKNMRGSVGVTKWPFPSVWQNKNTSSTCFRRCNSMELCLLVLLNFKLAGLLYRILTHKVTHCVWNTCRSMASKCALYP